MLCACKRRISSETVPLLSPRESHSCSSQSAPSFRCKHSSDCLCAVLAPLLSLSLSSFPSFYFFLSFPLSSFLPFLPSFSASVLVSVFPSFALSSLPSLLPPSPPQDGSRLLSPAAPPFPQPFPLSVSLTPGQVTSREPQPGRGCWCALSPPAPPSRRRGKSPAICGERRALLPAPAKRGASALPRNFFSCGIPSSRSASPGKPKGAVSSSTPSTPRSSAFARTKPGGARPVATGCWRRPSLPHPVATGEAPPGFEHFFFCFSRPTLPRAGAGRGELLGPPGKCLSAMLIPALAEILPERFPGTRRSGAPMRGHPPPAPNPPPEPREKVQGRAAPPLPSGICPKRRGKDGGQRCCRGEKRGKDQPSASVLAPLPPAEPATPAAPVAEGTSPAAPAGSAGAVLCGQRGLLAELLAWAERRRDAVRLHVLLL